jgi:hypothetical protein
MYRTVTSVASSGSLEYAATFYTVSFKSEIVRTIDKMWSSKTIKHAYFEIIGLNLTRLYLCLKLERGVAWALREMGSAWGRGVSEGPAPQEARDISSQCSTRAGTT